jgi:hypothetical protein
MTSTTARRLFLVALLVALAPSLAPAAEWKAGTAKAAITPKVSIWMAGYGARNKPSEGAIHDLWAKALAFQDPSGKKAVLVTLDLCGIDRNVSRRIRDAIEKAHGIGYDHIVLACSHTHSGPVVGENLTTMYKVDDEQRQLIAIYTGLLEGTVIRIVGQAFDRLEPVRLAWDTGRADFAVNRRNNKEADVSRLREQNALQGPVDHDVPVLRIVDSEQRVRAVVFGYSCHCTVLADYAFCGDYAGFAQIALEARYPGAQAMFVAGCGADQNPLPRRTVELAEHYGAELAGAVGTVVDATMRPITENLVAAYDELPLRFGELPTRAQIETDAVSTTFAVASRARMLLQTLDTKGSLRSSYPYPVQVWRLGSLCWLFLGGEVVVDYSLRFKRNLGSSHTWVSSYCNDVMAYIPSLRVLKEGGYEGATAMIYYAQPTSWSEAVEDQIVVAVTNLLNQTTPK